MRPMRPCSARTRGPATMVSLGVFTEPRRAAEAATIARTAGFEPRTVERTREADVFWLDIDRQASGGLPALEQLGADEPARAAARELRRLVRTRGSAGFRRAARRGAWLESSQRAGIAQLVEQPPCKRQVGGSTPSASTIVVLRPGTAGDCHGIVERPLREGFRPAGDAPGSTTDAAARPAEPRPAPVGVPTRRPGPRPVRSPRRPRRRRRSR